MACCLQKALEKLGITVWVSGWVSQRQVNFRSMTECIPHCPSATSPRTQGESLESLSSFPLRETHLESIPSLSHRKAGMFYYRPRLIEWNLTSLELNMWPSSKNKGKNKQLGRQLKYFYIIKMKLFQIKSTFISLPCVHSFNNISVCAYSLLYFFKKIKAPK